jgi:YD repeat-containing protein
MRPLDDFARLNAAVGSSLAEVGFVQDGKATRWRCDMNGRRLTAHFSRDRRTKYAGEIRTRHTLGYRLRIEVETSAKVRMYIVKKGVAENSLMRFVYRHFRRMYVLPEIPAGLEGFRIVTRNPDWARRLLARPAAISAMADLTVLRDEAGATSSVYFEPSTLCYASPRLRPENIVHNRFVTTVLELGDLAREADEIEAPERPEELGRFGAFAKANPMFAAAGIVFGFLGAPVALTMTILLALALLFG